MLLNLRASAEGLARAPARAGENALPHASPA
jgi:hypothetical protein